MAELKKPTFEGFAVLNGEQAVGYHRTDGVPIVHVIFQAKPGTMFQIGDHFQKCPICKDHGVDEDDFAAFMQSQHAGPFPVLDRDKA